MKYVNIEQPGVNATSNTMQPTFGFNYSITTVSLVGIEIATDPAFSTVIRFTSPGTDPAAWAGIDTSPNHSISFTLSTALAIPDGIYYWRAWIYDTSIMNFRYSETRKLTITDSTYRWRFKFGVLNEYFNPIRGGIVTSMELVGCQKVEKHIFKITFAPMVQARMTALKYFYDRSAGFTLYDNKNVAYLVYWGECERNINGDACPPVEREFGIILNNAIGGALRWSGSCTLTEK